MKVARWGNSLAIRIPAHVASALSLKAGDEVEIAIESGRKLIVGRNRDGEEAVDRLRRLAEDLKLPPGWKFNREEVYEERIRQLSK
jgi:antitoxin MazE